MRNKIFVLIEGILALLIASASLSFLLKVIGGDGLLSRGVFLKDVILLVLVFIALLFIIMRGRIRIVDRGVDTIAMLFMLICLVYLVKSPIPLGESAKFAWALLYGPLLYLSLNQIDLININIPRVNRIIYWWLIFIVVTGIIIYLTGQEAFFRIIGLYDFVLAESNGDPNLLTNFFRIDKNGEFYARMTGLLVSNLDMAFVLIFAFGMFLWQAKTKTTKYALFFIWVVAVWLTTNRSVVIGIIFSLTFLKLLKQRLFIRIFATVGALALLVAGVWFMGTSLIESGKLDSSVVTHFYDLFIRGPQLVVNNWKGAGIGMASGSLAGVVSSEQFVGNIESFYYMLSIEIGVFGLAIYLLLIWFILRRFLRLAEATGGGMFENPYLVIFIIVFSLHVSAVFLPVLQSRVLSSMMWTLIFTGLNLSRYRQRCGFDALQSVSSAEAL